MIDLWHLPVLMLAAYSASLLAGVTGFGGVFILLPAMLIYYPVREALPVVTIAMAAANLHRFWLYRKQVHYREALLFAAGAVPMVVVGVRVFAVTPPGIMIRVLGVFLLITVALRRLPALRHRRFNPRWFFPLGVAFGFVTGLIEGTGPLVGPFLLAYGLLKGAFIGTIGLIYVGMYIPKLLTLGFSGLLTPPVVTLGLIFAPCMFLGVWTAKFIVDRISERAFVLLIEVVIATAAVILIVRG
ncbi:MAG: sulfite exporter TauE/SafE family protein [Candidatus Lambdaproteobacteria bacterium]|nr:sulfite exporter TauE/SafE family protein [Candidatus Lambdaproteobacteria bacterium]